MSKEDFLEHTQTTINSARTILENLDKGGLEFDEGKNYSLSGKEIDNSWRIIPSRFKM